MFRSKIAWAIREGSDSVGAGQTRPYTVTPLPNGSGYFRAKHFLV